MIKCIILIIIAIISIYQLLLQLSVILITIWLVIVKLPILVIIPVIISYNKNFAHTYMKPFAIEVRKKSIRHQLTHQLF